MLRSHCSFKRLLCITWWMRYSSGSAEASMVQHSISVAVEQLCSKEKHGALLLETGWGKGVIIRL